MTTTKTAAETFCRKSYPEAWVRSRPNGNTRTYAVCTHVNGKMTAVTSECRSPGLAWSALQKKITPEYSKKELDKQRSLQNIFDSFGNTAAISWSRKGAFGIQWSEKGRGFGEYCFFKDGKRGWVLDNECDSRETVARVMRTLVMSLPLVYEKPEGEDEAHK